MWGILNLVTNYIFVKVGLQALLSLRTDLYAYLQSLSLKFHDARRSADSSFRVAYDSQSIQTIYNKGFTNIFGSVITLVGIFVIMMRLDWQLTLLSLGIVPLIVGAIYFFAHRIRTESTSIQEQESAVLAQVQEGLSCDSDGARLWSRRFRGVAISSARPTKPAGQPAPRPDAGEKRARHLHSHGRGARPRCITLAHCTFSPARSRSVRSSSSVLISLMLYQPLEALTYTAWAMEGATGGARRCFEVLDREDDVRDSPDAIAISETRAAIAFEKCQLRLRREASGPARRSTSQISPNQIVALVGGTGAGKSTLLSLVPRFYDPNAGVVRLDGRDLREITKKSFRAQIAIVLQDTLLFSTTVRENIAYGRPDATEDEIREAARRAQADDFICRMPNGYDSAVGERGGHLSVGQRQRIGIARAFLKNAPILLLDEPTSALDPTTEAAIMETIKELMHGRTTLIVTHRLATIHNVDQIVVLEHGRIVERGRGSELVAQHGAYAKFYAAGNYPTQ